MEPSKNFENFSKETFNIEWEKMKEKNREEDRKARELMDSIKETQAKSAAVIISNTQTQKRITQTLSGVKGTLKDIKDTNNKIDTFKKEYEDALRGLAERCALSMSDPIKKMEGRDYPYLPEKIPMKEAVARMMKHDHILFLTGAGISAPSGIQTFRGKGGFWTCTIRDKEQQYKAESILTRMFWHEHPDIVWKWHEDFRSILNNCKPNPGHINLDKCCRQLVKVTPQETQRGKKVTLVTQNLDNLHIEPVGYKLYHIHGDINFVRCENFHLSPFDSTLAKCKQCGEPIRPYTLFFDEPCTELADSEVKNGRFPFTVSVGTALETNLAKKLVVSSEQVIEVNPEPVIEVGRVYPFTSNAQIAFAEMEQQIIRFKPE